MKYTKDELMDIARRVYTQELTHQEAMEKYSIGHTCLYKYISLYKESIGIPVKNHTSNLAKCSSRKKAASDIEAYMAMTKEELIDELIRAKANELRAKKGYEVKGVGANKEFIFLSNKNMKL